MSHSEFGARLDERTRQAVLSFPLTPFTSSAELDLPAFGEHLQVQLEADPAALFVCCGTGEFFSLAEPEYEELVAIAVQETAGTVPVVAGVGYGWPQATRFAAAAERAGADGLLVLPHYLVGAPQAGLVRQVTELANRTTLPLIVYQRDQVKYTAESFSEIAKLPSVVGLKDGHGDLDQLQRLRLVAPPNFLFLNGVPTAEMQARSYRALGITAYSSAVHAFAPEIATTFFHALRDGNDPAVDRLLAEFYWPLVELRDRQAGYAVSLVKAAARLRGYRVGPVRAPLVDPSPDDLAVLERLLSTGISLAQKVNS